ncbi:MAG: hypothetical protein FJ302_07530 [Planctomycetes bacterium]|nr:hypothetical protein [Planctomycetota bacterium]
MSFKSFDFFDQRIAASGAFTGRRTTPLPQSNQKFGKLRKSVGINTGLTINALASREEPQMCGDFMACEIDA